MCGLKSLVLVVVAVTTLWISSSAATELVMFRRDGCPWCQAWNREIGPIYGKTDVGRRAPLRMVYIDRDRPELSLKGPVIYTPTFVLVEQGSEIARIEGYAGDHFFWGLIKGLLERSPPGSSNVSATQP